MDSRGALLFLLGVWCGASLFMWMVATQNFRVVDNVLQAPPHEFAALAEELEAEDVRLLMRHQASEVNRRFFYGWGAVQVPLAMIVVLLMWRARAGKLPFAAAIVLLLIVFGLQVYVVPETIRLGRMLDFAQRVPPPPQESKFWTLHHTYTALDMLKFLLALGSGIWLVWKRKPASGVFSEGASEA